MKHYTPKQWLAIVLALSLWSVETWFLIDAAGWIMNPAVAAIPVATAALAFLPLALDEASGWFMRAAMLLAAVFLGAHVLGSVIERTGEALDTKIATASAKGEARKLLESELAASKRSLIDAQRQAKNACAKPWTDACHGMERREKAYQARVDQLTAELVDAPVAAPADPVATRLAAFTVGAVSPATASLWRPVLLPFGCLIGIWSLLAFGFKRKQNAEPSARDSMQTSLPSPELFAGDIGGGLPEPKPLPNRPPRGGMHKDIVRQIIVSELADGHHYGSQDELAERFGRSKSTISEWLKEWEQDGIIPERTVRGRCKELAA